MTISQARDALNRANKAGKYAENRGLNRKAEREYDRRATDFQNIGKTATRTGPVLSGYHKPGSRKKVY